MKLVKNVNAHYKDHINIIINVINVNKIISLISIIIYALHAQLIQLIIKHLWAVIAINKEVSSGIT